MKCTQKGDLWGSKGGPLFSISLIYKGISAKKGVEHGYRVFILPNPKGFRTADFIFERKGVYKMFDLKTIQGKSSAMNRLLESVGQTNHVLLNITTNYRAVSLASCIKRYFEINPNAVEILVFKGNKEILG